jgi:DHA2 family multidrug resistance protein
MRYIEARTTMMAGLALTAFTLYLMSGFTNDTTAKTIFMVGAIQGFAFGMVFVSVNTVAFLTLPDHLRTYGSSFQTLVRNISSSFGISVVISQLTEGARRSRAELGDFVNPFNDALKMPDVTRIMDITTDSGRALAEQMLSMQALIIAYANDFRLLTIFALCALPVALIIGKTKETFREKTRVPVELQRRPPEPQGEPAE